MPWIQIRINATAKTADKVSNMLLGRGAQAVTFMDAKDVPVYEPMPGETPLWGETEVMGLFDAETDPAPTIAFFQQIFGEDVGYKVEQLEDKDWVREWMDHFHPMQFGERLWICPSWRDVPNPDAVNVMLDPGLAFGTGTHPTTALCLQWLDGLDLAGKTVVDFGCGSGILGIAALKLGRPGSSASTSIRRRFRPAVTTPSAMASPIRSSSICRRISRKTSKRTWWSPTSWPARCANWRRLSPATAKRAA